MADPRSSYIELIILGAGPAYSDVPGSFGSSYLLRTPDGRAILLDLGQGCFPSLASMQEPSELSAVFVSHLHPDHFIDLIPLRHYLRRPGGEANHLIPVLGPDGLDRRIDATFGITGFAAAAFEPRPLSTGRVRADPFLLDIAQVRHTDASFAVRVALDEEGSGLVYTGDVSDIEDIRPLIRPGDLLLSEATFGPGPAPASMPHLDASLVGRLAAETGAAQVVITHVRMGMDLAATMASLRARYDGPASMARPGSRYLVPAG